MPHMLYQNPPEIYLSLVMDILHKYLLRCNVWWLQHYNSLAWLYTFMLYLTCLKVHRDWEWLMSDSLGMLCSSFLNLLWLWPPDCFWPGEAVAFDEWVGRAGVPGEAGAARWFPVIIWGVTTDLELNWRRNRDTEKYCFSFKIATCAMTKVQNLLSEKLSKNVGKLLHFVDVCIYLILSDKKHSVRKQHFFLYPQKS